MPMNTISSSDIVAEQFANDWLLVIENDRDSWNELIELVKNAKKTNVFGEDMGYDITLIADELRDEWNTLIDQMADAVESKVSDLGALLLRQMLVTGDQPFRIIARYVINRIKEAN